MTQHQSILHLISSNIIIKCHGLGRRIAISIARIPVPQCERLPSRSSNICCVLGVRAKRGTHECGFDTEDSRESFLHTVHRILRLSGVEGSQIGMGPSVAANHVASGVGILDIADPLIFVDAVPVVAVEEEGGLGFGVGEGIGDLAQVVVWTVVLCELVRSLSNSKCCSQETHKCQSDLIRVYALVVDCGCGPFVLQSSKLSLFGSFKDRDKNIPREDGQRSLERGKERIIHTVSLGGP
jgi:hypothetical protein